MGSRDKVNECDTSPIEALCRGRRFFRWCYQERILAQPSLEKPSLLQLTIFFKRSFSPPLSQAPYAFFVDTQS